MNDEKMTPWFPGSIQPARPGVYQRKDHLGMLDYSRWDGKDWHLGSLSLESAAAFEPLTYSPGLRWRGLAQDPKP